MASPVIGYATLQVIPSMRGVQDAIRRELGALGDGPGRQAGDRMGRGMGAALSSALGSATQAAYRALEGASLTAGATAAAALVKGYGRLTTIQDAQAALTISLQSSTDAAALLGDTLDVVRGTPFNLDQFAAAAQRMAGMGIEAQKIPAYLTAIGEASATQGRQANEFADRLSRVFGQAAAAGQLQLADVWRISDTGVNALGVLANSFGVTRDEMKDMISAGAVPAGQALDALARGILEGTDGPAGATTALAGTMESLRENLSGAVAGIDSAMARLGESILEPFSPVLVAGANAFADTLDRIGERAGGLSDRLASSAAVERFVEILEDAPDHVDRLLDSLSDIAPIAGAAAGALAGVGVSGLSRMLGPLGLVLPQLGPLPGLLFGLVSASPAARDALGEVAGELGPVVAALGEQLAPVVAEVSDALETVLPAAVRAGGAALVALADASVDVVAAVGPIVGAILDIGSPIIVGALETVAGLIEDHSEVLVIAAAAWGALKAAAITSSAWSAISGAIAGVTGTVTTLTTAIGEIAAARGVSNATAAFGVLKSSISEVATTAAITSAAIGGFAAVAAGIWVSWQNETRKAERATDEFFRNLDLNVESVSPTEILDALNTATSRVNELNSELQEYAGLVGAFRALGEWIDPTSPNRFMELATSIGATGEEAERLAERFEILDDAATMSGLSYEQFARWAAKLNFDPATQSAVDMAIAIHDARRLADTGKPSLDRLADSFEILQDETSSATDQLKAFKEGLDAIIGVQVTFEQAQLGFHDSIAEFATSARDAMLAGEEWSGNLFAADKASRETRRSVSGLVDEAVKMATAFYESGGGIEGATWKLAEARDQIIRAGEAAGISREDMEAYLETLNLTPDNITTLIEAWADEESVSGANRALDTVAEPRSALLKAQADYASVDAAEQILEYVARDREMTITIGELRTRTGTIINSPDAIERLFEERWGGITEYARGGLHGPLTAHIGFGDIIRYAEPATGGEAFIPRLGDRDRSMSVLRTAASWLDAGIIDKKRISGSASTRTITGPSTTNITLNAVPMDTAAELQAHGGRRLRKMGLVAR